jgi:hypothetical protein
MFSMQFVSKHPVAVSIQMSVLLLFVRQHATVSVNILYSITTYFGRNGHPLVYTDVI